MSKENNNTGWIWVGLIVIGFLGFGPLNIAKCSSGESEVKTQQQWDGSFTGSKYTCSGGCLCTKYQKISTYNANCKNCLALNGGHHGPH